MFKKPYRGKRLIPQDKERKRNPGRRAAALFLSAALLLNSVPAFAVTSRDAGLEYCTCGEVLHTHSDACSQTKLICGLEEQVAHTHEEETCFTQVLDCGEDELHTHTVDECYEQKVICEDESPEHEHDEDTCYESILVCEKKEVFGHQHDDDCMDPDPICGEEEGIAHEHGEACYTKTITCGSDEVAAHNHDDSCYTSKQTCEDTSEEHVHDADACYTDELSCGLEVTAGHQHGDACYTSELTCDLEEGYTHYHDDSCYSTEYICGMEVGEGHTHSARCYSEEQTCELAEQDEDHVHEEGCWLTINTCGLEEHQYIEGVCPAPEEEKKAEETVSFPYVDDVYVCLSDTELYEIEDFQSANGTIVTFVLADDENVYDVLNDELPVDFAGKAELSIYLEFMSAQIKAFGDQCYVAFTGISLDEPIYEAVTDNDGNEVGSYVVNTDGTIYIMLNDDGMALDTLTFFQSFDVTVSNGAEVSIVGVDEDFTGGDLIICKQMAVTNEPLTGAQFALYEESDITTLYQSGRTTSTLFGGATNETVFRDLQPGTYYLVETVAPEGYVRDEQVYTITVLEDYSFSIYPELETVDVNTTYSLDETAMGSHAVSFANAAPQYSELYIKVVDSKTGAIIPGFKFTRYYDEDLSYPEEGVIASDGSSYFGNWQIGRTYYIKETTTPAGYTPDNTLYAVTSEGSDTFSSVPTGLLPTSNSFEPTNDRVFSVGTVYSSRAANNIAIGVDKSLTSNFPTGEYEFQFQIEYDIGDGNGAQTETQTVMATVDEDGSYSFDTEALFSWYINASDASEKTITFTLKELQPSDSNVLIPDYWYGGTIEYIQPAGADPFSLDDGIATAANIPNTLTIDVDKIFEDGTSEDFYDYSESWTGSEQEISLPFENDYFIPDDNVTFPIQKTLTDNFPAGEYEFSFQVDYEEYGASAGTEIVTLTATVDENGFYTIDGGLDFGSYLDSDSTPDLNLYDSLTFTIKELQPEDANVIIPNYWYEGTVECSLADIEYNSLVAAAAAEGLWTYPQGISITIEKCYADGTRESFYESTNGEWYGDTIKVSLPFQNDYTIPANITKQVLVGEENGVAQWGPFTTADYGDTVTFKLTGTMPTNLTSFSTYSYEFKDFYSFAFTPDKSTFNVTINGQTVPSSAYTLDCPEPSSDAMYGFFTLTFTDILAVMLDMGITAAIKDIRVEVTYSAEYQEPTFVDASPFVSVPDPVPTGGANMAYLTSGAGSTTDIVTATTYSFNTIVKKIDENGNALSGAIFKLQKLNDTTGEYEDYEVKSTTAASFNFDGMSEGSYRLIETTAPAGGYETIDPFDFTITCGSNFDTDKTDYEISYDKHRSDVGMSFSFNENLGQGNITFSVTNYANPIEVKKEVLEFNDDAPDNQVWQSWATHDMGDIVEYKITGTLPGWVGNRTTFPLTIHDRFERTYNYLPILNTDSIEVYLAGELVPETEYSLSLLEACTDGCAFDIVFADILTTMDNLGISKTSGSELVVTYDVTLGTDWKPLALTSTYDVAPVDYDDDTYYGDINVAWFEYLNVSGFTTITDYAQATVYSIDVLINKNDENEVPLAGAEFKLQKWDGTKFVDRSASDEYSPDGTQLYFYGLDVGKYRIIETKAPEGYQQAADITFEFDLEPNDDGTAGITFVSDDSEYGAYFMDGGYYIDFYIVNYPIEPSITKEVLEFNDDAPSTQTWQSWATHDNGDTIQYRLTGTLPGNFASYTTYSYAFHDNVAGRLTVDPEKVIVTIDGNRVAAGNYTVSTSCSDGCDLEVSFTDLKAVITSMNLTVDHETPIVVTYEAKLDTSLTAEGTPGDTNYLGDINTAWLVYTTSDGTGTSDEATARVYTFDLQVTKKDDEGNDLPGAAFELQKWNGTAYEFYQTGTAVTDTEFLFTGLDEGQYKLVETTTPEWHTKAEDMEFTFTVTVGEDNIPNLSISYVGDGPSYTAGAPMLTASVINPHIAYLPEELPNTGGMGTYLFYGGGILLIIGGIIFFAKRKKDDEEDQ